MKRFVAAAMLCCAVAVPARADEASKRAKVEELFRVIKINQMTDQIIGSVQKQMANMTRSMPNANSLTPEQKKLLADYQTKVMGLVNETVGWKELEPQMVQLYSSTYSEGEIDGILAFYKGPVGQAMLAKTPELTQKSMELSQGKLAALQPKVQAMSQEFAKQFQAAAAPAPAPAGAGASKAPASH